MSVSQCQCVSVSVAVAKSMNTSVISRRRPLSHIDININIKNKMANIYPVVDAAVPEVKVENQDKLHKYKYLSAVNSSLDTRAVV